jgi:transposase
VDAQPDITLAELQVRMAKEKLAVSQTSIFRFLRHLGFSFKKKSARSRTRPTGRSRSAESMVQDADQARSKKARIHR